MRRQQRQAERKPEELRPAEGPGRDIADWGEINRALSNTVFRRGEGSFLLRWRRKFVSFAEKFSPIQLPRSDRPHIGEDCTRRYS